MSDYHATPDGHGGFHISQNNNWGCLILLICLPLKYFRGIFISMPIWVPAFLLLSATFNNPLLVFFIWVILFILVVYIANKLIEKILKLVKFE